MKLVLACDLLDGTARRAVAAAAGNGVDVAELDEHAPAEAYRTAIGGADIVVGRPPARVLLGSGVRFVQIPRAGFEAYLGAGLEHEPGLVLCSARGVFSPCVAEHAVALLIALARRVPSHAREFERAVWRRAPTAAYLELAGERVCVIGLGDIGTEIVRRCSGLGMEVVGVRRKPVAQPEVARVYGLDELSAAVADAPFVIVALPGGAGTRHLLGKEAFSSFRRGALFVNVGRGSVVDEDALVSSLEDGHLGGAALDVTEEEPPQPMSRLWAAPNLVLTPHCAGQSPKNAARMTALAVENVRRFVDCEPLLNQVALGQD
jgi:phosphoglycerate dehydrogenase-like enzyme